MDAINPYNKTSKYFFFVKPWKSVIALLVINTGAASAKVCLHLIFCQMNLERANN